MPHFHRFHHYARHRKRNEDLQATGITRTHTRPKNLISHLLPNVRRGITLGQNLDRRRKLRQTETYCSCFTDVHSTFSCRTSVCFYNVSLSLCSLTQSRATCNFQKLNEAIVVMASNFAWLQTTFETVFLSRMKKEKEKKYIYISIRREIIENGSLHSIITVVRYSTISERKKPRQRSNQFRFRFKPNGRYLRIAASV